MNKGIYIISNITKEYKDITLLNIEIINNIKLNKIILNIFLNKNKKKKWKIKLKFNINNKIIAT